MASDRAPGNVDPSPLAPQRGHVAGNSASNAAPLTSRANQRDEPSTLLQRADAERRAGRTDDAVRTLQQLIDQHPRAPEAALAAFTLGQLSRTRGDLPAARRWFSRALELGLPPPLADRVRDGGL